MLNIGEVLIQQSRPDEALQRFEESRLLAEKTGEKRIASRAYESLAGVYATQGDTARELEHLKKHYAIEQEIFNEEASKRIVIFNMRVAIAEIEHGVEVQKLQIEHMEHDLANSAIQLSTQTDLLDHFQTDLRLILKEIDEPIAALRRIKEKLKAMPFSQIDWQKFEAQFTSVHPEFKSKLEAKYPALTHQELRMCSLVRVGLRNPEIAKLLSLSERTLENHRFNIRKKFALRTEQGLQEFLSRSV